MAEPAAVAADLAADVAAHHAVILAAKERHEAVHALAILSAKAGGATDKTCAQLKLGEDCGAEAEVQGCCRRCWSWWVYPAPSSVCARQRR